MIEVSLKDFYSANLNYLEALVLLPPHIQFFLPDKFDTLLHGHSSRLEYFYSRDVVVLDEPAYAKYKMCMSPHVRTLLHAWVVKHNSFVEVMK